MHRYWNCWDPGVFDEPDESSGRGLRGLLADLGVEPARGGDWFDRTDAAVEAGPDRLLPRLRHADLEIRRMTTHALSWSWADAGMILPALREHLPAENDPPTRAGIVSAAANLTTQLPDEARPAAIAWLEECLGHPDPVLRFNAALGWCEFLLLPEDPLPAVVLSALAGALHDGGPAWEELWGRGWDRASSAAMDALYPRDADRLVYLARLTEQPVRPPRFNSLLVNTVQNVFSRDGGLTAEPRLLPVAGRLIETIGDLLADPALPARDRIGIATSLAHVRNGVARPAADALVVALDDPDRDVREQAAHALARSGDHRCLPAVRAILARDQLPRDVQHLISGMRVHAADLLPAVAQRLARAPDAGGYLSPLIAGLASWGRAAAPLEPDLRRLLAIEEAREDPATSRSWHPAPQIRTTLTAVCATG